MECIKLPIILTPFASGSLCYGHSCQIADEQKLADYIARVALGQASNVMRILKDADLLPSTPRESCISGAKKLLTKNNNKDPSHRDGWMFQVMSWIAANVAANVVTPRPIIRNPHMIHAHKGFDGLQINIDPENLGNLAVVIFEDKATINPREVIRNDVWNGFKQLEKGEKDNELVAEISSLLNNGKYNEIEVHKAIDNIMWKKIRNYRVSITVDDDQLQLENLFKGYNDVVSGDVLRRRGEVYQIKDLRQWMDKLAQIAINIIETIAYV